MNESLYKKVLNEMMNDPRIRSMQQYPQHGSCNTYQHSVYVAEDAYRIARFLHMRVRETELARGGMIFISIISERAASVPGGTEPVMRLWRWRMRKQIIS